MRLRRPRFFERLVQTLSILNLLFVIGISAQKHNHRETFESVFRLNPTSSSEVERAADDKFKSLKSAEGRLADLEEFDEHRHGTFPGENESNEESTRFIDSDFVLKPDVEVSPNYDLSRKNDAEKNGKYVSYDSDLPEAERYAPRRDDMKPFYVLTDERLRKIRSEFMYWYFDKGGDEDMGDYQKDIHSSITQIRKNLNFQLPFFGYRFNYTRLSLNGYLEFSDPPQYLTYPLVFPVKEWPKENDPSFIGIFYTKARIGKLREMDIDKRKPGVYFRMERDLQRRTDQIGREMHARVMWDVREGIVGADTFNPKHAVIVTWKNISFAGGIGRSLTTTNTFQMVLATDEVFTYAIFNYLDIQWTTHTEADGDTTKGEQGIPAFVGFNAGNGTQSYEYKPYSQATTIRDLTGRGWANGFPGRHIFRIDEKIMLGNCNKDIAGANLPLVFAPESGNMLGGTIVSITGPCFKATDKVRCRFDTEEVLGTVINSNRAICIQPFVKAEGYIRFSVAVNNGRYDWKGKYFIETPATATEKIFFTDRSVHERNPAEIRIQWDPFNLTSTLDYIVSNGPIKNNNSILDKGVQISLWGYRETTIRPELEYITDLQFPRINYPLLLNEHMLITKEQYDLKNTGNYVITPANYRLRENTFHQDMYFGFIQINLTNPTEYSGLRISPALWSKPIPLGWYFGPQWERRYGQYWPEMLCDKWIMHDRYLKNFAAEISLCPCTLEHALNDKGRFLPDFSCDKDSNPECFYNRGAVHCVKTGAPNLDGAEQQCCYDKLGYLMLTYDQQWGSKPHRSHNLGYLPWNEANKVPTLSHWFHDMVPMYLCCLWQEEQSVGCETFRFERRPSQDCIAYQSPAVATVFGDPHIVTFDGLEYTFNGKGEFVLVRVNDVKDKLDIQARFEQLSDNLYGEVKATQLTAIAARGNNSAVIEVRLRPPYAQWRYRLDVFADGQRVYFDRTSLKYQHFKGVVVYTPTYILNQSEVIMMFETGVGVEVIENEGYMATRVYLPWTYMNKTRGLFGNWSNDITDEFVFGNGSMAMLSNLNDFEQIHKKFASAWQLDDHENEDIGAAMFTRNFGRTSSYYTNRTFAPEWKRFINEILPSNRTDDMKMAKELCGDNYQCQFDYVLSLKRDMAHFTKNYYDTYSQIKAMNQKKIISCGILETPRFGRKSNFLFVPGTKVTFECNQDFVLIGDQRRTCTPEGRWNLPEYGYTECLHQQEYSSRQAGITVGIILACLVPILLLVICAASRIFKNRKKEQEEDHALARARQSELQRIRKLAEDGNGDSPTSGRATEIQ